MSKMKSLALLFATSLLLSSCVVSKKKYEAAEAGRWSALYSRDSLANLLSASRMQSEKLMKDTVRLGANLRNHQALLENKLTENKKLNELLNSNLNENQKLNELLSSNLNENQKLNTELADKIKELEHRELVINRLQDIINDQSIKVAELLDNVKNAMNGFSTDELSVREEGGKIYVAMSDKLLFESGRAVVNEQGKKALGQLASVLKQRTDIDVHCEGHTDSIPIKTNVFKDNWDLSVIRATSVVRILTETYGVNPLQITPSGRGEHKPVDSNQTPEGRAKNRRTEIIITPNLDQLFEVLDNTELQYQPKGLIDDLYLIKTKE